MLDLKNKNNIVSFKLKKMSITSLKPDKLLEISQSIASNLNANAVKNNIPHKILKFF